MTGLDKLQEIGAHKIYEKTHIARKFVEDILNQRYSSMNKIQFAGFISIIEREYNVDLHELIEAYSTQLNINSSRHDEPFVVSQQESERPSQTKFFYVGAGLVAMVLAVLILKPSPHEDTSNSEASPVETPSVVQELNNTTIEEAKLNLNNLGNTTAKVETLELAEEARIEPAHRSKFEIKPRSQLWIGIIDLETFKRTQRLDSASFELDKDKDWLLVMGHGYVNFDVNGEEQKFKDEKKVWFSYENGVLTKLSRSEFKEKNRGKAW